MFKQYAVETVLSVRDHFTANIDKYNRGLRKVGDITVSSISKANKALDKFAVSGAKKFGNFAKNAVIGTTVAGVGLGAFAIKAAADMEMMSSTMETAFKGNKKMAQDYFAWANKFSNVTPFENAEVIQASVMLSMRGLDPKKVLGTVGDLAASMGRPLGDAVQGLLQASVGEMEIIKGFGISKEDIRKHGISMGFNDLVNTKGSITDAKKFTTVLLNLMESKTKGSMEKQSKTFKGVMSTLKGVSTFAMSKFAGVQNDGTIRIGSAFDLVKKRLDSYVERLNNAVDDGTLDRWASNFDKLAEIGANIFSELSTWASSAFTDINESISSLTADDISKWGEDVKSTFAGVKTVIDGLASAIKWVQGAFNWIKDNATILKYVGGAWAGAKAGAVAGSVVPGVGNVVGAVGGAVLGAGAVAATDVYKKSRPEEYPDYVPDFQEKPTGIKAVNESLEGKRSESVVKEIEVTKEKEILTKENTKEIVKETKVINVNITGANTFNNGLDMEAFGIELKNHLATVT